MIKTLKESKARLSELVSAAASGEEVVITVRGRAKARLVGMGPANAKAGEGSWKNRLKRLQARYSRSAKRGAVPALDEVREDRW